MLSLTKKNNQKYKQTNHPTVDDDDDDVRLHLLIDEGKYKPIDIDVMQNVGEQ